MATILGAAKKTPANNQREIQHPGPSIRSKSNGVQETPMQPTSNNKPQIRFRPTTQLNPKLDKKLIAYVVAGTAGLMASAQLADAEIVFTPAHTVIPLDVKVPLNLNHDGTPEFSFYLCNCPPFVTSLRILGAKFNGVLAAKSGNVEAGLYGLPVGPGIKFLYKQSTGAMGFLGNLATAFRRSTTFGKSFTDGQWANVTNRYLGLKVLVDGEFHYGWARLNVNMKTLSVLLTGYAYETTPNLRILEGHQTGPEKHGDSASTDPLAHPAPQPASLGMLALGAPGLVAWRREKEVLAQ
jgi:hypothetical protein